MRTIFKALLGTASVLLAISGTAHADTTPTDLLRAEEIVASRCFMCHGPQGASASPIYPRLAGQHSEYITKQLNDFKTEKRKSDAMKSQAETLSDAEMKALGLFFESKPAGKRKASDPELTAVGHYIFTRGNPFSGVPACASCHGPKGYGTPQLPRLAGQHPRYIEEQLKQFNSRERNNDNAVMHTVASKLSELERHAVAEYIATLE